MSLQAANIADEIDRGERLIPTLPGVKDFALIGSALYLPEQAQDVDFAVLLADETVDLDAYAMGLCEGEHDFKACTEYDIDAGWFSVRRGYLNLMITSKREFFDGYVLAMEVCKVLRLTDKADRIAVCRVVRDREPANFVRPTDPSIINPEELW